MRARTLLPIFFALLTGCGLDDRPSPSEPEALVVADRCGLAGTVAEVLARLDALSVEVTALDEGDIISRGRATALKQHLVNARRDLQSANLCQAVQQIDVFRKQLLSWRAQGALTDRQASPLLGAVRLLFEAPAVAGVGAESYAPGVAGVVRTVTLNGSTLTYQVIDGLAIYQADIILGFADEFEAAVAGAAGMSGQTDVTQSAICPFNFICSDWPQMTIRYRILDDWGDLATNQMMNARIEEAIAHWEARTPIRFERDGMGGPTVTFRKSTGCSAGIGRMIFTGEDGQNVNLSTLCGVGAIIHEIGHTVGLWHEHSRSDRDDYVTVRFNLTEGADLTNFFIIPSLLSRDVGPYDYSSIMHYGCLAFLKPGLFGNTVEPNRPGYDCSDIGQRSDLSAGDLRGVYELYPPFFRITGGSAIPDFTFDLAIEFLGNPVAAGDIVWRSNRPEVTGELGRGLTLSIRPGDLPSGPHIIDAAIVYEGVPLFSATTLVEVFDPIQITSPADNSFTVGRAENVHFTAVVNPGVRQPAVVWTSTQGTAPAVVIGSGLSFSRSDLPYGIHRIKATVTGIRGLSASESVRVTVANIRPVLEILQPSDGANICLGETIDLLGDADDPNGPLTDDRFQWGWWSADGVGYGGATGRRAATVFETAGSWIVTLLVIDDGGARVSEQVTLEVANCGNLPPAVTITTPAVDTTPYDPDFFHDDFDTALGLFYKDVTLVGEAIDPEDGLLTGAALSWRRGSGVKIFPIGTGETVSVRLFSNACTGSWHTVQLVAEDSGGEKRTAIRRIFIGGLC